MSFLYDEKNNILSGGDFWLDPTDGGTKSGPITVTQDGVILSQSGFALDLTGGSYTLVVNGLIASKTTVGIHLDTGVLSKITVGDSGSVFGDLTGISSSQAVNIANNGLIVGKTGISISGGATAFSIINTGIIDGDSDNKGIELFGTGKHTISNKGDISGNVIGGTGIDVITNSKNVFGDIKGGEGADSVTNSGFCGGLVDLGNGDNKLSNSGTIDGDNNQSITCGTGVDIVSNKGFLTGEVDLGGGNDKFTNSSVFDFNVHLGSGDDIFVGSKHFDRVVDESGSDNYKLGDGSDVYFAAEGNGSNDGIDIIDGGGNKDLLNPLNNQGDNYDASQSTASVFINIDTVSHADIFDTSVVGGVVYAAAKATGADVGVDLLKNFEAVEGGSAADVIFGNKFENDLRGENGDDHIFGFAGNDRLTGGDGVDKIVGGLGADQIDTGSADGDADRIVYFSAAESSNKLSGRDTLGGFEDGKDKIDLSAITSGVCFFRGENADFQPSITPIPFAQARVVETDYGWTVQLDLKEDFTVDMAIDIVDSGHLIDWTTADFIF